MRCPHCHQLFHDFWKETHLQIIEPPIIRKTPPDPTKARVTICPCGRRTIQLTIEEGGGAEEYVTVWPAEHTRPLPPEVPVPFKDDFAEAVAVLPISPKASAALARRCLQTVLREKAGIKKRDLADEIEELLVSKVLPTHLSENVDAIRQFGNFSAHPIRDAAGQIVDVEPHEAEWTINLLESLFDFYFVAPEREKKKRTELDAKLAAAKKPPMRKG